MCECNTYSCCYDAANLSAAAIVVNVVVAVVAVDVDDVVIGAYAGVACVAAVTAVSDVSDVSVMCPTYIAVQITVRIGRVANECH